MRMSRGIVLLALAQGLTGCGGAGSSSAPSAPSSVPQPVPQPTPIQLAVFTDPASGFSTSDVRDVQEQIVRFNTRASSSGPPTTRAFRNTSSTATSSPSTTALTSYSKSALGPREASGEPT